MAAPALVSAWSAFTRVLWRCWASRRPEPAGGFFVVQLAAVLGGLAGGGGGCRMPWAVGGGHRGSPCATGHAHAPPAIDAGRVSHMHRHTCSAPSESRVVMMLYPNIGTSADAAGRNRRHCRHCPRTQLPGNEGLARACHVAVARALARQVMHAAPG